MFIFEFVLGVVLSIVCMFYLFYAFFTQKEKYFIKNLQVGDICRYYPTETEDRLCEVIDIDGDIVKIKDKCGGVIYDTNIRNIVYP